MFETTRASFERNGIVLASGGIPGAWVINVVGGELEPFLQPLKRAVGAEVDVEARFYALVMVSLIEGGVFDLSAQLGHSCDWGMSNESVRLVVDEINESYIIPLGLEITSHGLLRSFRFWSREEKVAYLAEASRVLDLLCGRYGDACLGYGAVLSYVRSGDLSPHDDDLDVLVGMDMATFPTFTSAVSELSDLFVSHGYDVVGRWPAFLKITRPDFVGDIDVFVALREGDSVAAIPGPRHTIQWGSVFPSVPGALYGVSLPMPRLAEDYLRGVYGESWRVPKRGWQHRWNYDEYADVT